MTVLIYYPYFSETVGGGEYIPLSIAKDLQKEHKIILLTRTVFDFERVEKQYGIRLLKENIDVHELHPKSNFARFFNVFFRNYETETIKKWAKIADVCISCHDVVDFGKPGIHFMCLSNFDYEYQRWLTGIPLPHRKLSHRIFRFVFDGIRNIIYGKNRTPREIFSDPREKIFPNSKFVAKAVASYYGRKDLEVFYPPTLFSPLPLEINKSGVVYIGRIDWEKRVDAIIEVVERTRKITKTNLILKIAGFIPDDEYGNKIREIANERPWVRLLGPVVGDEKRDLLAKSAYAIHGRIYENFGISVTEYLKAGIVPIVPDKGGATEIVACDELTYGTIDEATAILSKLVCDESFRHRMLDYCLERGDEFSSKKYWARQRDLLARIIDSNKVHSTIE